MDFSENVFRRKLANETSVYFKVRFEVILCRDVIELIINNAWIENTILKLKQSKHQPHNKCFKFSKQKIKLLA